MIIQNHELFRELSQETIFEISKVMVEQRFEKGATIYTQKDRALYFYILGEGNVRLTMAEQAEIDYSVTRTGEVFGWSSMVGRQLYTANAECLQPSKVYMIDKEKLITIFQKNPKDGMKFFERLAAAVVQRLVDNYHAFITGGTLQGVTYGSGQILGAGEE
jgi:CRP-like cAMP-binding protein